MTSALHAKVAGEKNKEREIHPIGHEKNQPRKKRKKKKGEKNILKKKITTETMGRGGPSPRDMGKATLVKEGRTRWLATEKKKREVKEEKVLWGREEIGRSSAKTELPRLGQEF